MKIKKGVIIAVLAVFCLTTTLLFMPTPTRSLSPMGTYDPWIDLNDDGIIDVYDAIVFAGHYNTQGTPLQNRTALLDQQSQIDSLNASLQELQTRIDSLNASLFALQTVLNARITTLEAKVDEQQIKIGELETELAVMNATKLGQPDYDSGWFQLNKSQSIILVHNLNTTDVMVYMMGNDTEGGRYVNQVGYGGDNYVGGALGVYWDELTSATIRVNRANGDNYWDMVRFFIWKVYR
jgi:uncharacterized coiled-coil protein SlyX